MPASPEAYFLVFMRVGAMVLTLPIFSSRNIPAIAKVGLTAILAFVLAPTLVPTIPTAMFPYVVMIGQELLLGLLLGFAVQVVFAGVQMAGQVLGIQMGLNIASTLDPLTSSSQLSYMDQLYGVVAGLIFLTINGHHWVIRGLQASFDIVPLGRFALAEPVANNIVVLFTEAFVISIRIGLPVMAALLITDLAFLIIGRAAPQMNIFFVGQPVKIGVGLVAFAFALPMMTALMTTEFRALLDDLTRLLRVAA